MPQPTAIATTESAPTCAPWCTNHDEFGCMTAARVVPLSLTEDEMISTLELDTETGESQIVTWRGDEMPTNMTPQEAAKYAVQLWELAALAQGGRVKA